MLKWSGLLTPLGGGRQPHFSKDFFSQLDKDMLMVDDYGYVGIDFRQEPDLVLPNGEDWDASLSKKHVFSFHAVIFVCFLNFIMFFGVWYNKHSILQIVCRYDQQGCPRYNVGVH